MPVCCCWEITKRENLNVVLVVLWESLTFVFVTLGGWDLCLATWVLQELSDPLLLPALLCFVWYHLASPHSGIVSVQVTFLCASICCLALWTRGAQSVLCEARVLCHGFVPVFPGAARLRSFCSSPKTPTGAGSRWKQATHGCILCQRYWNSLVQMSNHFHLKSWENKCLQTAALWQNACLLLVWRVFTEETNRGEICQGYW